MPTVYSTADAGIEYQGDKKKKKQNPTTASTVAEIRQNLAQDEYRQEVQNFREAAKAEEVSPYKMARIIASGVTAEDTYNQVYEKFTEGLLAQDDPKTPENEGLLYLSQLNDPTATAMLFDQWRSKKKMDYWRTDFPSQIGPLTIVHGVSLPELQSAAVSQIFNDVAATYGGEAAAMALQNSLTGDPEQQAETWKLIEALSQRTVATGDSWEARQPDFLADPGTTPEIPITELFAQVLMDPAKFDTLSPGQQQDLITAAGQQLDAHQEMLDSGIIDQVTAAQDVLMKQKGWKTVLSKEEAQRIRSFYDSPQAVAAREKFNLEQNLSGDVAVSGQLGDLGIERYRDKGGVQTFTFQEEWVKQNFAKYEGIKSLILAKFPNAEFIYGVNGIVGQVLDSIGAGTDVISAPFSAAGIQAKELGSRIGTSPEDRQGWLDYADFIQAEIDAGRVPEAEMANAVSEMYEFRDRGTDTFGLSTLWQDTQKYSQPGHFGTGFGDAITQSLEFYPGDPGYEGAHAALTLFGNIVFDPTIVFGKVFKAARLAKSLPAGTVISKSRMTQILFDALAQPPEMLLASKRGLGVMDSIMAASAKVADDDLLTIRLIDMGMDESIASEIAKAAGAGRESLQSTMLKHMMGDGATPILQRKLLPQLDDVSKGLARIEVDLPKQIKSIKSKLQYRTTKLNRLNTPVYPEGTVFHGTKANVASADQLDALVYGDPQALVGPGTYFTSDATVATGYSVTKGKGAVGQVLPAQISPEAVLLNLDEPAPQALIDTFMEQVSSLDVVVSVDDFQGLTGYKAMQKFRELLGEAEIPRSEATDIFDSVQYRLSLEGYNGFEYAGNVKRAAGVPKHRVSVLFDGPSVNQPQMYSAVQDARFRPVTLANQKLDSTGRAVGDLTTDDYVWVKTQDLADNIDTQLRRVGTDVPVTGYETSLQQEILTNGYPKPLEVMFDPATGRYSLTAGNHGLAAALAIGDEYVPVRTVTAFPFASETDFAIAEAKKGTYLQEISRYVPPTHPTPLTELAPEKFRGLSTKTEEEIAKLTDQLSAAQEELKIAQAGKTDLVSQKAFIESVLNGPSSRTLTPLRRLPTKTSLRGLAPSETAWGRIWDAATGTIRFEGDPSKVNRLFQTVRRWGQDTGTGEKLSFQLNKVVAGALPDEAGLQTYKKIRDFARFVGTPDDVIEDALKGLLKAQHTGSKSQIYDAFVKGYEDIVENASRIPTIGKPDLKRMWGTSFVDRNTALVVEGEGAAARSRPALWENSVDARGQVFDAAVPSIEADMLQVFKLPSFEQMRDYVGFIRAHAKGMQQAGKLKKGAADVYFGLTKSWRGFNALWTQGVLLGRMPFALPARIQLEQMVRIEAVGYSSILHPSEWWKSVRSKGQFTQFAMDEREVLGVSVENYMDARKVAGEFKRIVTMSDEPDVAIRAMAGRIKAFNASPSSRLYVSDMTDAEIVAKMQADPFYWDTFGDLWDDVIKSHTATDGPLTSYEAIVHNIRKQYTDILGQGDGVERLRAAIKSGAITIDGKNLKLVDSKMLDAKTGKLVTEDGNLLADEMQRMYKNGEWTPHIYQFPAESAHYMPPDRGSILRNVSKGRDWAFEHFYARPDLKFGRRPLARQIAAREYTRLTKLGWSPAQAAEQARVFGARQTADILFTIGANSSADYFARGLMPFFPAWKELARTWLVKVPATMGGGGLAGWAVGSAALSQRVDAWVHFFEDTGITYKDGDQWRVKAPFLAPLVEKLTGLEGIDTSFSVDSFTSLLPVPSASDDDAFYKGLLPTLGAPSGLVLHKINNQFGGALDGLEEALTLFGGDQSLGPASLDNVLNAMGYTPPWQSGQSAHMQELRREWATIDALRVHYDEMYDTMPKQKDYKNENLFLKAQGAWLEELLGKAESSSKKWYLLRGISGTLFPFSFKYDTEASRSMTAMWDVLNGVETSLGDKGLTSPLLEAYRHMHPDRELYLTGKTVSLLPDNPDRVDDYSTFIDEIAEGTRLTFTSEQWLVWAMGSQEAALHRGLTDKIFNEFGSSPQKWLLSGYETAKKLRDEQIRWDGYLKQSSILSDILGVTDAAGEPTSFEQMYSNFYEAKQNRYSDLALGDTPHASLTLQQEQATEALDALNSLADFFGATQYTDASYLEVRRTLNDVADVVYEKSDDPVFRATGWWWNQVRPYFDAKNAVWSKIDATPSSARAPLYRKLAEIENDWATKQLKHPEWGVMPKPQDVMFQKLSPDARQLKLMDWATLPIEFLSRYQRQKVYGKSPKDTKLDTLVARISENEESLDSIVNAKALSYSSTEYTDLRAFTDRKNAEAAKDLGVSDIYAKWQQPAYKRVSTQIHNPYWDQLVNFVDSGMRQFVSADVSPRGSTAEAAEFQRRVIALAEQYRATDPNLNKIMEQLEIAYGEGPDKPAPRQDMYWPLFFDGFGTAPGYLLNTYNPYLGA